MNMVSVGQVVAWQGSLVLCLESLCGEVCLCPAHPCCALLIKYADGVQFFYYHTII